MFAFYFSCVKLMAGFISRCRHLVSVHILLPTPCSPTHFIDFLLLLRWFAPRQCLVPINF